MGMEARRVAVGLVLALAAAGCGTGSAGLATKGSSPPVTATSSRPPPQASASGTATVTGVIQRGAEPSCLLVDGPHGQLLLVGDRLAKLRVGERVTVTGHVVTGIATHCMQGTPFEVTSVVVAASP